jgi:hypothetical protein
MDRPVNTATCPVSFALSSHSAAYLFCRNDVFYLRDFRIVDNGGKVGPRSEIVDDRECDDEWDHNESDDYLAKILDALNTGSK